MDHIRQAQDFVQIFGNQHHAGPACPRLQQPAGDFASSAHIEPARRLIGQDQAIVADVLQETLLAVARSGRNLGESSRLWPWLAAIAHNQVALHWRKQHRRQTGLLAVEPVSDELRPEEVMQQQEDSAQVRSILVEMSPEHVSVLEAKYIDELSIAEIVETFGGTTESVRSQLARARRDFSKRIRSRSLVEE